MSALVSVAICTYNRCERLRVVLDSLTRVRIPDGVEWEVLIVDNNSTDSTRATVESYADRLPVNYLFEPMQGHNYAYNRAIARAQGTLLLFTDDDTQVDAEWVRAMWNAAQEYPEADFFGGKVLPLWECDPPSWFDLDALHCLRGMIAFHEKGDSILNYHERAVPVGANMGFRTRVFEKVGTFRLDLGPQGRDGLLAGETELCRRLMRAGIQGIYVPQAVVRHAVPPERCTKRYVWNWHVRLGRSDARMNDVPESKRRVAGVPGWMVRGLVKHALAMTAATLRRQQVLQVYHLAFLGLRWGEALETRHQLAERAHTAKL